MAVVSFSDSSILADYDKRWEEIQARGVLPEITTLQEYKRRYEANLTRMHTALADHRGMLTDPGELKELHGLLFYNITPWAGKFRKVPLRVSPIVGVPSELAESEFRLLDLQIEKLGRQLKRTSQTELIRLVAFQHARFEYIHAFPDGNGRLGRILVEHAMELITRQPPRDQIDRMDYQRCLNQAQWNGNIASLSDMLHRAYLLKNDGIGFLPAPYQLAPQIAERAITDSLKMSQREPLKIIGVKSPPLERRWFSESDWVSMLDLPKAHITSNFLKAERFMRDIQRKKMSFGDAIMSIRKVQLMEPYRLPGEPPPVSAQRYLLFADGLFKSVFLAMTPESQDALAQGYADLFVRSVRLQAEDFNELYTKAKYQTGELPRHISQPLIDTFRREKPSQTGPGEKKEKGPRLGQ